MYKLRKPDNQLLDEIKMVEMQYEDVERSQIVKTMLQLYSKDESTSTNSKPSRHQETQCCSKKSESDNDAALIPKKQLPTTDFI
jgi:metal-responsive CopG/Arc/MetJ family transcriptional regulator